MAIVRVHSHDVRLENSHLPTRRRRRLSRRGSVSAGRPAHHRHAEALGEDDSLVTMKRLRARRAPHGRLRALPAQCLRAKRSRPRGQTPPAAEPPPRKAAVEREAVAEQKGRSCDGSWRVFSAAARKDSTPRSSLRQNVATVRRDTKPGYSQPALSGRVCVCFVADLSFEHAKAASAPVARFGSRLFVAPFLRPACAPPARQFAAESTMSPHPGRVGDADRRYCRSSRRLIAAGGEFG